MSIVVQAGDQYRLVGFFKIFGFFADIINEWKVMRWHGTTFSFFALGNKSYLKN